MRKLEGYLYLLVVTVVTAGRYHREGRQLGDCFYNGRYHDVGDGFPATDGCNGCFCAAPGQVGCSLMGCPDRCTLPIEPGNCNDILLRWGYNSLFNQCQPFIYTGCDGNDNNFETYEECAGRCPSRTWWKKSRIG
ncbi:kunitz-type serine protease inhibitor Bi-KTI-like [Saccostrea echinata]|uniref:kunitz-type serine protease inhibitor Bi-KTI-like n=1 Tax=Saccostrea echinata TaxID=191078 RepID=UPI002A840053|nr:kunitz-type serine protease inhibitor Bi-KTI-like isoform X2 [Saccostrea echinata]XP_061190743.1 kunitz-type serine protease inhibitor Bi-KTI-like [Saccostrea echinata]